MDALSGIGLLLNDGYHNLALHPLLWIAMLVILEIAKSYESHRRDQP